MDVEVEGRVNVRFAVDPRSDPDSDPVAARLRDQPAISDTPIELVLTCNADVGRRRRVLDVGAHLGTNALSAATMGYRGSRSKRRGATLGCFGWRPSTVTFARSQSSTPPQPVVHLQHEFDFDGGS